MKFGEDVPQSCLDMMGSSNWFAPLLKIGNTYFCAAPCIFRRGNLVHDDVMKHWYVSIAYV